MGVAIDRGMVPGAETPIRTYFPEIATDKDARKQRITIEDLLSGERYTWDGARAYVRLDPAVRVGQIFRLASDAA